MADEMPIHDEYRRRLIAATETDAEWYPDLYDVGWPHARIALSATRQPKRGTPPAVRHSSAVRARVTSSRTSAPANRFFGMNGTADGGYRRRH